MRVRVRVQMRSKFGDGWDGNFFLGGVWGVWGGQRFVSNKNHFTTGLSFMQQWMDMHLLAENSDRWPRIQALIPLNTLCTAELSVCKSAHVMTIRQPCNNCQGSALDLFA